MLARQVAEDDAREEAARKAALRRERAARHSPTLMAVTGVCLLIMTVMLVPLFMLMFMIILLHVMQKRGVQWAIEIQDSPRKRVRAWP